MPSGLKAVILGNASADEVGILDPRYALIRKAPIGTAWNEVRMGMFYTWVPVAGATPDDMACAAETLTPASCLDWLSFGLSNGYQGAPGRDNVDFIGTLWSCLAAGSTVILPTNAAGTVSLTTDGGGAHNYHASYHGATEIAKANTAVAITFPIWSANCHAYYGLRFRVVNPGAANQRVDVTAQISTGPYVDTSLAALRTAVFNAAYGAEQAINWFSGGAALPLLDYIAVRSPFNNNRLRISNVHAWKIS